MSGSDATSWTMLSEAATGDPGARGEFARRYAPVVRRYLAARWGGQALLSDLDDATQEVFLECLRDGGALSRAQPGFPGGFRAFLYGVVRNVALRFEKKAQRQAKLEALGNESVADSEPTLSHVFDRAWAESVMRLAAERMGERAAGNAEAERRVELLRLRFQENQAIREIARAWGVEAAGVHREYAKARDEFRAALLEVLAFHHPGAVDLEAECGELLGLLG